MKFTTLFSIFCIVMILPINASTNLPANPDLISVQAINPTSFVSQWNTTLTSTGSSNSSQIKLPLGPSVTNDYNFTVDWGDGNNDTITIYNQMEVIHTYISEGVYTLVITGTLVGWKFNNGGDKLKLIEISQWGNIHLGYGGSYFYGCANLVLTATDAPDLTGIVSLYAAFMECYSLGSTGSMDTWDVSSVINMGGMFYRASSFNQPIGSWNVSSVTNMVNLFDQASNFNQTLGSWDVSSVTDMFSLFNLASSFNQPLSSWDVSSVTDMSYMFTMASSFNQPIGNWDVSGVTNMGGMFLGVSSFNQPLESWNVSRVNDMFSMLSYASSFNQPIGSWNVSSVINMGGMFRYASSFNKPIGSWNVSSVSNMRSMFSSASSFNQPIEYWDVSSVLDMAWMFYSASSFNQPFGSWDVSFVNNMAYMFGRALSFNQPIGRWNVSSVADMTNMFDGVILIYQNYDDMLMGWSNLTLQSNVIFHAGYSRYSSNVIASRQYIIDTFGWSISDGGLGEITPPDISRPVDVSYKFGTTGNQITWVVGDINPGTYEITVDGLLYKTGTWINGTISVDIDGLAIGIYEFIIFSYDVWGYLASDTVMVTVLEITLPDISSPDDFSYELGLNGSQIIWTVGDQNPGIYNVTLDGVLYGTDSWTNGTITVDIDGLDIGIHEFIIYIYDLSGNMVSDTVIVTILDNSPPDISSPKDVSYKLGSIGNNIIWSVWDLNFGIYNVTLGGNLYLTADWINGNISVNIDDLAVGVYEFIIFVYDSHGNMVSDTVIVTVTEITSDVPETSETIETTQPTSKSSTDVSDNAPSQINSWLIFFSLGLVSVFRRKRKK